MGFYNILFKPIFINEKPSWEYMSIKVIKGSLKVQRPRLTFFPKNQYRLWLGPFKAHFRIIIIMMSSALISGWCITSHSTWWDSCHQSSLIVSAVKEKSQSRHIRCYQCFSRGPDTHLPMAGTFTAHTHTHQLVTASRQLCYYRCPGSGFKNTGSN